MASAVKWGILGAVFGASLAAIAGWNQLSLLWLIASACLLFGLLGVLAGWQRKQGRGSFSQREQQLVRRIQELEGRLHLFETATNALDTAFAMYDADERLVVCNRAYAEFNELAKDVGLTSPTYEQVVKGRFAVHPEYQNDLPSGLTFDEWLKARLVEFRNPQAPRVAVMNGRWTRIDDKRMADGSTVCMRSDVSSLKQAEFEARVQEQRLKLATSSAGIGIWETDFATNRLVWDARMEAIYGYAPGTFPGTLEAWKSHIHPQDLARVEASIALSDQQGGTDFQDTYRIVLPDGSVRHIDRRGSYIKDVLGNVVRRLGTNQDITEHVEKAEKLKIALVAAQAAAQAKAEFLATMSHEIRTPMNGVIGMTDLLLCTSLDPMQQEYAETIRASGEALLAIINDILDFSKMEAGKLTLEQLPFSVTQVAKESLGLFVNQARSKGVQLLSSLPDIPTDVLGDPARLRQILLNLISNALKFTQAGHVQIRVSAQQVEATRLNLEIEVSDTGIGMSPDYLARLGEAFSQADTSTTRQFGGTGLGLSICRNLVQLMLGSMTVRSTAGVGTCFLVFLPLAVAGPTASGRTQVVYPELAFRLGRVLVAEDNSVNQRVILALLKKFADQVDLAVDGFEAFEKFKQESYDCILMDGQMPNLDGLGATRLIRMYEAEHSRARTPIIALTASAMTTDRDLFLAAGMDEYVTKPVRSGDLVAALTRVKALRATPK